MTTLRADGGAVVSLGKVVGSGGEGVVFRINEQPASVAKIYSQPLRRDQAAKLAAMVAVADDPLRRVAAWPTSMLYAGTRPVGFAMPLVAAQRPLHELLGPRSRHELFPNAHWSFLIHAARNLARAFAVLHERNGDMLTQMSEARAVEKGILDPDGTLAEQHVPVIAECRTVASLGETHYTADCVFQDGRTAQVLGESESGTLPPAGWFVGRPVDDAANYRLPDQLASGR